MKWTWEIGDILTKQEMAYCNQQMWKSKRELRRHASALKAKALAKQHKVDVLDTEVGEIKAVSLYDQEDINERVQMRSTRPVHVYSHDGALLIRGGTESDDTFHPDVRSLGECETWRLYI